MGGLSALLAAARRPDLVTAVVVEDMAVDLTVLPSNAADEYAGVEQPYPSLAAVREAFHGVGDYMTECVEERADGYHLLVDLADATAIATHWTHTAHWDALDAVRAPTLLIEAEDSIVPPGQAEAMARRITGAEHVRIPGTGHLRARRPGRHVPGARASPVPRTCHLLGGDHALQERADVLLGLGLLDAEPGEHAGPVLVLEQREQDVLGADVVVPEPQRVAERQLQDLAGVRVERDQGRDVVDLRGQRRDDGAPQRVRRDAPIGDRLRGHALGLADQSEHECAVRISALPASRASSCAATTTLRARGVNRLKPWFGSSASLGLGGLGNEPLLGGLLGHAHALADVGPGRAGAPGPVDEVADQVVGHLAEVLTDENGVRQLVELVRVTFVMPAIRSSRRMVGMSLIRPP